MSDKISCDLRMELEIILKSFLQSKGDDTPPTISKYDIPHIVDVIGRRITQKMVSGAAPVSNGEGT